jgi:hypothetical protein
VGLLTPGAWSLRSWPRFADYLGTVAVLVKQLDIRCGVDMVCARHSQNPHAVAIELFDGSLLTLGEVSDHENAS